MNTNSLYLPFLFLLLTNFSLFAQEDGEYYSLKEALAANPQDVRSLDLSEESFQTLPKSLNAFTKLKELSVNGIQLQEIGDFWAAFPELEYLDLDDNEIKSLPPSFTKLQKLKTLYLADNQLSEESLKQIAQLKNLEELNLSNNKTLTTANWNALANLQELKTIELLRLKLKTCPDVLSKLPKLNYVDLGENEIENVQMTFGPSFHNIDLSDNPLHTLDIQAPNLKELYLNRTKIQILPKKLPQLYYLSIDNAEMQEIPRQIMAYTQLKELSLIGNKIGELPQGLTQLQQLEELYLSNNQLMELPAFFAQIPNLTELHLDNNIIGINNLKTPMKKLKLIYLSDNIIDADFFKGEYMPALEELYLTNCMLTNCPNFTGAPNLKTLYLDENMIEILHPSLIQLKKLEELDVASNEKLVFPKGMENLPLTSLNISSSVSIDDVLEEDVVYDFPSFIAKLPKLESLEIANIPYKTIPKTWAAKSTLIYLDVSGTNIPYEQIKELGLYLDQCEISWK
ncbi:leucine-rich repeat protein [Saprospira sp. CCB-QB6]|uniref:leucine-rich repeat domain-containing protein n=1 Tax=Saprospira sp. CCB-QB6 TaxID=3023936 RepID=UPI00234A289A|nr:leucine-rich repeat protein [Saprospira sp. CCB-QB6]WCL82754.1 leucine-rich repeat protein [Saprospira sp. CCB-QB6]